MSLTKKLFEQEQELELTDPQYDPQYDAEYLDYMREIEQEKTKED